MNIGYLKWFKTFKSLLKRTRFLTVHAQDKSDTPWTVGMKKLLRKMANQLGYRVIPERALRVDLFWVKRGKRRHFRADIALEHENNGGDLDTLFDHEVTHLLSTNSPLKVLVTYFPHRVFRRRMNECTARLGSILDRYARDGKISDFTFLLVAAPNNVSDVSQIEYVAFRPGFIRKSNNIHDMSLAKWFKKT